MCLFFSGLHFFMFEVHFRNQPVYDYLIHRYAAEVRPYIQHMLWLYGMDTV